MERQIKQWIEQWIEQGHKRLRAWLDRHPGVEVLGVLAACVGGLVLTLAVIVPWVDQLTANTPLMLGIIALCVVTGFVSDHYGRKRRRAAAAKQAEQLKRENPQLAAVIDILETYRAVADDDASATSLIQSLLFLAAGIAIPIFLPVIIAKLQAP